MTKSDVKINNKVIEVKLRPILEERNMSQKQLADITGLSTRTVSELASNMTQRYSKDALERICEALDVEVGELLTIEKRKHNEK